jgi:hypothetical protein
VNRSSLQKTHAPLYDCLADNFLEGDDTPARRRLLSVSVSRSWNDLIFDNAGTTLATVSSKLVPGTDLVAISERVWR